MRVLIGGGVLVVCLALAAAGLCWWLAGNGRHRAPRRAPVAALPPGVEPVLLQAPPVLPGGDVDTVAFREADRADFAHCPAEARRTAHFFHADGSRTCCGCATETAGE